MWQLRVGARGQLQYPRLRSHPPVFEARSHWELRANPSGQVSWPTGFFCSCFSGTRIPSTTPGLDLMWIPWIKCSSSCMHRKQFTAWTKPKVNFSKWASSCHVYIPCVIKLHESPLLPPPSLLLATFLSVDRIPSAVMAHLFYPQPQSFLHLSWIFILTSTQTQFIIPLRENMVICLSVSRLLYLTQ